MASRKIPASGSSPRLRGTPSTSPVWCSRRRFIPASAGNTWSTGIRCWRRPVHPRVCGEHFSTSDNTGIATGSSPRLRGTRLRPDVLARGISVHPRVCGEHAVMGQLRRLSPGSSPRLRGTRHQLMAAGAHHRFIPASAGNTVFVSGVSGIWWVHPRVCGEHAPAVRHRGEIAGSSPRLRGTQL